MRCSKKVKHHCARLRDDAAYSVYSGQGDRYGIILPGGQAYLQIELAGIVAGSDQVELAHAFLNHLLSPESQKLVPTTNWMFPANAVTELPECSSNMPINRTTPCAWTTAWLMKTTIVGCVIGL